MNLRLLLFALAVAGPGSLSSAAPGEANDAAEPWLKERLDWFQDLKFGFMMHCMTLGDQWSFKPGDKYKSAHRLVHLLVDVVGKGGNFLLNVGPEPDGELPAAAVERLQEVGEWMKVNDQAIYGTRPIAPYKEGQVVFTRKDRHVYAIYLTSKEGEGLPERLTISALKPTPGSTITLLGAKGALPWHADAQGRTLIEIPASLRQTPPCRHAFVFSLLISDRVDGL